MTQFPAILCRLYTGTELTLNRLQPLTLLGIRIWVAIIFFKSGWVKIMDMENTKLLFKYEYQVPYLPVAFAAWSATIFELLMPALLVVGLFTRAAALPLLIMTAVIEFTYQSHLQHAYWAMMLGILMIFGAGKYSLDQRLLCVK